MFVMYAILFAAAVHNTVRFLSQGERYKNFHITYFYVLVYLVIILRIVWLSFILDAISMYPDSSEKYNPHSIFELDVIATYLELLIGIQQTGSMFELYLMIKETKTMVSSERNSEVSNPIVTSQITRGTMHTNSRISQPCDKILLKIEQIKRQGKKARIGLYAISIIVFGIMIFECSNSVWKEGIDNPIYGYVTLSLFAIAGVFCFVTLSMLVWTTRIFQQDLS